MQIRHATDTDRLALFKLAVAMHRETDFQAFVLDPQKTVQSLTYWTTQPDALALLAEHADAGPIGFFLGKMTTPWFSNDPTAVEDCFYVLPEHRGSRAAYMLVREFVAWARQRDARHVRAGVSSGRGRGGERLYEHFGMSNMGGNFIAHLKEQGNAAGR